MTLRMMDAVQGIQNADHDAQIALILTRFAADLGYESWHLARSSACDVPLAKKKLISVWPEAWTDQYDAQRLVQHDAIARACKSSLKSFRWSDIPITEDRSKRVMTVANDDYRMRDGYCVPYYALNGYQGAVSFAGKTIDPLRRRDLSLEVVAIYAFNRLNEIRIAKPAKPLLTDRQREVMHWIAAGKTSWDAAAILSISEDTVKKIIKCAMLRLNVHTRAQAVAEAVRLHEITI